MTDTKTPTELAGDAHTLAGAIRLSHNYHRETDSGDLHCAARMLDRLGAALLTLEDERRLARENADGNAHGWRGEAARWRLAAEKVSAAALGKPHHAAPGANPEEWAEKVANEITKEPAYLAQDARILAGNIDAALAAEDDEDATGRYEVLLQNAASLLDILAAHIAPPPAPPVSVDIWGED